MKSEREANLERGLALALGMLNNFEMSAYNGCGKPSSDEFDAIMALYAGDYSRMHTIDEALSGPCYDEEFLFDLLYVKAPKESERT